MYKKFMLKLRYRFLIANYLINFFVKNFNCKIYIQILIINLNIFLLR